MSAPVFLICSERSGSNLIRSMMDAHPEVSAPPTLKIICDVMARADALTPGTDRDALRSILDDHLRKPVARQLDRSVANAVADQIAALPKPDLRADITETFATIREAHGARVLFLKENELFRAGALLIDSFPDAKFVFQVRNPRDVLSSARVLRSGWLGNTFGSFRNAMQLWNDGQTFGLQLLGYFGPSGCFSSATKTLSPPRRPFSKTYATSSACRSTRRCSRSTKPTVRPSSPSGWTRSRTSTSR